MTTRTEKNQPVPSFQPFTSSLPFMVNRNILITLVVLISVWELSSAVHASDQIPGADQTGPVAITAATIHTVAGPAVQAGTLVFENGLITQVGTNVTLPANCQIIRAEGKHVYPSLIEAHSDLGLVEINSVRATQDSREVGEMNPNVRAISAFNPDSEIIPVNRANGILLALTAPGGGILSGRSSLMMLDGWTWEDMALQQDIAMHLRWPRTEESVHALETIVEHAERYRAAISSNNADSRPNQQRDLRLDALAQVLPQAANDSKPQMPVIVHANSIDEIRSAVAFGHQYQLRIIIHGGADANRCATLLRQEAVPVILSGVYRLPRRRHAAYDSAYALPSLLEKQGVAYCISAGGRFGANGIRNLPYHAATAAAYGLSEEKALRSITLSAAEILGVQNRVGALTPERDATFFIASGNILETETQVETAFIQGRQVDLDNKHRQLYRKYSTKYARQANQEDSASQEQN